MKKLILLASVLAALVLGGFHEGSGQAADWSSSVGNAVPPCFVPSCAAVLVPTAYTPGVKGGKLAPKDGCARVKGRGMLARKPVCGGSYPNHWITSGDGYCFINSDWGPGASPRYTMRPCF